MTDIFLYNTLSRTKELFVPIDGSLVRVYSCGPTVYSSPHIGNFRAFTLADILRATLRHVGGYTIQHVMNITDVGHLTDDGDQGEDKMEKGAKKEGLTVWEIARKYEQDFLDCMHSFAIEDFDVMPRATAYMSQQIAMVKQLTEQGYTYSIPGDGIYMDTSKINDYGKLAQLDITGLCSHHREEGAMIDVSEKRQITDFALWKFSPRDQKRAMERVFDGPRTGSLLIETSQPDQRKGAIVSREDLTQEEEATRGFPGRHIECSAMSVDILGEHFDIHTGGVDHIPVHHTNEIAQAECALGTKKWVNYWLHQQFLNVDGGKMSKSKGHDLSVAGILREGYDPLDVRYFYLTAHYRSFLDFTREALDAAKKSRTNIMKKIATIIDVSGGEEGTTGDLYDELSQAMADDLDTVQVLTLMHTALANPSQQDILDILAFDDVVTKMGLRVGVATWVEKNSSEAPEEIRVLADKRLVAKQEKNYASADELREKILASGWVVKDTPDGYDLIMQ